MDWLPTTPRCKKCGMEMLLKEKEEAGAFTTSVTYLRIFFCPVCKPSLLVR